MCSAGILAVSFGSYKGCYFCVDGMLVASRSIGSTFGSLFTADLPCDFGPASATRLDAIEVRIRTTLTLGWVINRC